MGAGNYNRGGKELVVVVLDLLTLMYVAHSVVNVGILKIIDAHMLQKLTPRTFNNVQ